MRKRKFYSALKYLPLALCIILIIWYLRNSEEITVQTILDYTPDNLLAAALVLLCLYALKSISIVFPIIVLEVAAGHLFPTIIAFLINISGIVIGMIESYFVGYFSGSGAIDKVTKKYPAIEKIIQKQGSNPFFTCFFLRTLCILPRDGVSIYLGATRVPFGIYLLASTLGSLTNTILATLFGTSITEVTSPVFWISILLMILFAGGSLLVYRIFVKDKEPV
ncbi:MAG: TVP38/TMEM64 family membrane protein [Lachnoclostridium sp.]